MERREQIQKLKSEVQSITLMARFGKQQGPLALNPVRDSTTGELRGVQVLTDEEKRTCPRIVNADTTRKISDGLVLDFRKKTDEIDADWILENKEICFSWEEALSEPNCLFYIFQPDKEIDDRINKNADKFKAMKIVYEYNLDQQKDLCLYLGFDAGTSREKDVKDHLLSIAEANPSRLVKAVEDDKFNTKIFLFHLIGRKIIRKDQHGAYRYDSLVIGLNETAAIHWLEDVKNRDLVGKLYSLVYGNEKPKAKTNIVDELQDLANAGSTNIDALGQAGKAVQTVEEEVL